MPKKVAFFDARPYDRKSFDEVNRKFGFDITYFEAHLNPNTVELSAGFDAVCAFVNDTLNAEVIEHLHQHQIGLIALRCAGYNNVDFKSALNKVHVVRVPAYSPYAVAEHAMALILALNRKTHRAFYRTRDGNFSINGLLGFDMYGKTAGVIGTGKIGKCLIAILKGFGMRILANDAYPDQKFAKANGVEYVSLEELYRQSDIISLHCPLTPATDHMINARTISSMKNGVMIINTGRGRLIHTEDLIEALKSGKVGSAGLDVYEEESEYFFEDFSTQVISDDVLARLLILPNVLITSHQGFFTAEALHNIAETTLSNIREYFDGGYLENEICYKCDHDCRKNEKKRCW
ncbi:MAG: 2-hydroxyacid dehydrogenase [Candidatus Marinimicrobia bacterium]|jgi:D-lactate dehydrogenase|nr:2-hydroxyacid dehydrogenase [Candidatus Neomarinimicrobiota bacterium]